MRLLSLSMRNFRQFEGSTPKVEFAHTGDRPITVLFGSNGSGKTALLNAFTWLFHGEFTDAFTERDQLVNRNAIRHAAVGESVSCEVEVQFEHIARKYVLRRTKTVTKCCEPENWQPETELVELQSAGDDGRWDDVPAGEIADTIGRILPKQLLSYFFFDGERIERLQRPDKRSEITTVVVMFTGGLAINRAVGHLRDAAKKLESELKAIGDPTTTELLNKKDECTKNKEELEGSLRQLDANLSGYRQQKQAIEQALRESAAAKDLQEEHDRLGKQSEDLRAALVQYRTNLSDLLSGDGYKVFSAPLSDKFLTVVRDLVDKGELPCDIKARFVQTLLDSGVCICRRGLKRGEEAYGEVEAWLERSSISAVEGMMLRMEGQVDRLRRDVPDVFARLDQDLELRRRSREQLSRAEEALALIRERLQGSTEQDVRELGARLKDVESKIEQLLVQRRVDSRQVDRWSSEIEELGKSILKLKAKSAQHEIAKRRLGACEGAIAVLEEVRGRLRSHFRLDLEEKINKIFSQISFKPYFATLSEDYSLLLRDHPDGPPIGVSTGESQILSLSFIGAIIEEAKENASEREGLPGPDSSAFPLVMDSPFGNLDHEYRREVAGGLPKLANQTILMVSPSQWQGMVEKAMEARVGKEFVLSYSSPKHDAQVVSIQRGGVAYSLVSRSQDGTETTTVLEVSRSGG